MNAGCSGTVDILFLGSKLAIGELRKMLLEFPHIADTVLPRPRYLMRRWLYVGLAYIQKIKDARQFPVDIALQTLIGAMN